MGNKYEFGLDILTDVLFRGGENSGSDYEDACKRYIWRAYIDMLRVKPWTSALKDPPGVINTLDEETGTATITSGSASVTLAASIAVSMTGRKFKIDDESVVYRISAHTTGTTAITLDATYKEDSVTAGAFTIFEDEYDLASDCLIPWRLWSRQHPNHIVHPVDEANLHEHYPNRTVTGMVERASIIGGRRIRISPRPESAETLEYAYTPIPSEFDYAGSDSGDTPIVALDERPIIADIALAWLMFDKNDPRLGVLKQLIQEQYGLAANTYAVRNKASMTPRYGLGRR